MAKLKYKEKNEEIPNLLEESTMTKTVAIYVQDIETPKQKMKLKVLAFFPKKNMIAFSYISANGTECGLELPIDSNLKFKNLKSGDNIEIDWD